MGRLDHQRGKGHLNDMQQLIIGDCLKGISVIIDERGRHRDLAQGPPLISRMRVGAATIIPTQGEQNLSRLVETLSLSDVQQIRLVLNGADETPLERFKNIEGIEVDYYPDRVGHDVGRAIGCMQPFCPGIAWKQFIQLTFCEPMPSARTCIMHQPVAHYNFLSLVIMWRPLRTYEKQLARVLIFLTLCAEVILQSITL